MKRFISLILTSVILTTIAMPVFAAEQNPKVYLKDIPSIEQHYQVTVDNAINANVDTIELQDFIQSAQSEVSTARPLATNDENSELPQIFEMTALGEDYSLNYYQEPNQEPVVTILESAARSVEEIETPQISPRTKPVSFADGIGVRIPIQGTTNKTLAFKVVTSSTNKTQNPINSSGTELGQCYLYGGFNANGIATDLGLIYQDTKAGIKGWKPYFLVKKGNTQLAYTYPDSSHADVTGKNGYIPGDSNGVGIEIYPNFNNTNKIRLRTEGRTLYSNQYGAAGNAWLIQIVETKNTVPVTGITGYKILATAGVPTSQDKNIAKARCSGVFSKISLGGSTPVFKEAESDNGYAQKDSSNGYTLSCSQGY